MENQSFNLNFALSDYSQVFFKIMLTVVLGYLFILTINFFRDKFISKEKISKDPKVTGLLSILNMLFLFAGLGFVVSSFIQNFLNSMANDPHRVLDWSKLAFGIILIFIGTGFKYARELIIKENQD
jgi:uncharacterized membrane protein YwzB